MKKINRTWFFIITTVLSLLLSSILWNSFNIMPEDDSVTLMLKWMMIGVTATLLVIVLYFIADCITIDVDETKGIVLMKWWKEKTGTRYITINKVLMPQSYKYTEYSIKVQSSYGTKIITTDVETYAKVEANDNIEVLKKTNILGEISYSLS